MLNKVIVMGRLTKDPELRRTQSGHAVASFSIACDRDFGSRENGEKETDFIDIVAWRNTAEFVSKYFAKGRMAVISGRLQIRSWTDKEGNGRRSAEILADSVYFGDSKPGGQAAGGPASAAQPTGAQGYPAPGAGGEGYAAQSTIYPAQGAGVPGYASPGSGRAGNPGAMPGYPPQAAGGSGPYNTQGFGVPVEPPMYPEIENDDELPF